MKSATASSQNSPCERCGVRPHSWFMGTGYYVCAVCMDEWRVFRRYLLENVT